jgi:transcriptional regulator with XRE-family HTH domain
MADHVGRLLYQARMRKTWTLAEVADGIKCSVPFLSYVERGLRRMTPKMIKQAGVVLEIDDALLYDNWIKDAVQEAHKEWVQTDEPELLNIPATYRITEDVYELSN